jgi:hypothetical protein
MRSEIDKRSATSFSAERGKAICLPTQGIRLKANDMNFNFFLFFFTGAQPR